MLEFQLKSIIDLDIRRLDMPFGMYCEPKADQDLGAVPVSQKDMMASFHQITLYTSALALPNITVDTMVEHGGHIAFERSKPAAVLSTPGTANVVLTQALSSTLSLEIRHSPDDLHLYGLVPF